MERLRGEMPADKPSAYYHGQPVSVSGTAEDLLLGLIKMPGKFTLSQLARSVVRKDDTTRDYLDDILKALQAVGASSALVWERGTRSRPAIYIFDATGFENRSATPPPATSSGPVTLQSDVYLSSSSPEFMQDFCRRISTSRDITLIGLGLAMLWGEEGKTALADRAKEEVGSIRICLGNPDSPSTQERWIEEDNFPYGADNLEGMRDYLVRLAERNKLIQVRLTEHYPPMSVFIFDEDVFFFPYPYIDKGQSSPVFRLARSDGIAGRVPKFFRDHADRVWRDAIPALEVRDAHEQRASPSWVGVGVYLIPDARTDVYKFGSALMGWDVYAQSGVAIPDDYTKFEEYAAPGSRFGFHATIVDPLLFYSAHQLERVKSEIQAVCHRLSRRTVDVLALASYRVGHTVALTATDDSGTVDVLRHELTSRLGRRALMSSYEAGDPHAHLEEAFTERERLMLALYKTPFALQEFDLHFTLLSGLAGAKPEAVRTDLADLYDRAVRDKSIVVDRVHLMTLRPGEDHWKIEESFRLGR